MPLRSGDFKQVFSIRSSKGHHASKLEAGAVGVAMRFMCRDPRWHRYRTFVLVDAQPFLHAARKGRSSAPNFTHGLRVIAAHSLAADLRVHYGYINTKFNPADPASRGIKVVSSSASSCGNLSIRGFWASSRAASKANKSRRPAKPSIHSSLHVLKRSVRHLKVYGTWPYKQPFISPWSSSCSSSRFRQPSN